MHGSNPGIPVPGLPGVRFREVDLPLARRTLRVMCAEAEAVRGATLDPGCGDAPYWAIGWPSARAFALRLSAMDLTGLQMLEIGCGAGLCALGAAEAGAIVTVTDMVPAALRLALVNTRRAGFAFRAFAADWRQWPVDARPFARVVASEVTYDPALFPALLDALDGSLAADGEAWLADPGRESTRGFLERAQHAGWLVDEEPLQDDAGREFQVCRLRRSRTDGTRQG